MAIDNPLRAATLAFQLVAMFATTTLHAQPAPPPSAADTEQPQPTQDVPLMQLEAPADRVVAPPPVASPPPAPAPFAPPPEQESLPTCDTSAAPSPCTQPSDAYRHDGFYFRVTNETQYLAFLGSGPEGDASVKGLASGGMLAIGGTPLPGLVIAGMLGTSSVRGTFNGRPQGQESDGSVSRAMLGVLADWFPQPDDGWHVGAAVGFAGITLTDSALEDAVGAAFSAKVFGGYDWWIGPQWTLGLAAVFAATPSSALVVDDGDESGYRFYSVSAGLAGSITLH
jgi:hypothetical protein